MKNRHFGSASPFLICTKFHMSASASLSSRKRRASTQLHASTSKRQHGFVPTFTDILSDTTTVLLPFLRLYDLLLLTSTCRSVRALRYVEESWLAWAAPQHQKIHRTLATRWFRVPPSRLKHLHFERISVYGRYYRKYIHLFKAIDVLHQCLSRFGTVEKWIDYGWTLSMRRQAKLELARMQEKEERVHGAS